MKKHIQNIKNRQPICGVAITDAKLEFLGEKDKTNRMVLGQTSTCRKCAKKILKVINLPKELK